MSELIIQWCSVCNSSPADGTLTVMLEGFEQEIPACEPCVLDPNKVEFI